MIDETNQKENINQKSSQIDDMHDDDNFITVDGIFIK